MQSGLFAAKQLPAGATQPIYHNVSGDWQIVAVNFCNTNSGQVARVALAMTAGVDPTPNDLDWIEWGTAVIENGSFDRTQIMLPDGAWIVAIADIGGVNCQVMGWGNGQFDESVEADTVTDGLTALTAAPSASAIIAATGTEVDGVYWIKPSPATPAQQVYCIMDPTWDGGGWMIVANNSAVNPVYTSGHQPRLTGRAQYVGTNGADSYTGTNNFSINVWGMPIQEVAWCAFDSNDWKSIYTYNYGRFDAPTYIPDTTVYTRVFDQYYQTLPWLSGFDVRIRPTWNVVPTTDQNSFSVIALYDGQRGDASFSSGSYYPVQVLGRQASGTVLTYPINNNNSNSYGVEGIFSWADASTTNGTTTNIFGWDDYQDGNSLSDLWGTASSQNYGRGLPSYIMVR